MTKIITILSVEGLESNTEVNFFEGMNCIFGSSILYVECFAIGKVANSNAQIKKFKGRCKRTIQRFTKDIKKSKREIFFIGDGDASEDLESMKHAIEIFENYYKSEFESLLLPCNINNNLIAPTNMAFDDILTQRNKNAKTSHLKRKSNKRIFNDFCEYYKYDTNDPKTLINNLKDHFNKYTDKYDPIFQMIEDSL